MTDGVTEELAADSPCERADSDALEEELEKELQDLEAEVQVLQHRLEKLQPAPSFEALPLEQLCLHLPAKEFATLSSAGQELQRMLQQLLPQLLKGLAMQAKAGRSGRQLPLGLTPLVLWQSLREPVLSVDTACPALGRGLLVLNLYPLRLRSVNVPRSRSHSNIHQILQPHELTWKMRGQLTPRVLRGKLSCSIAPVRGAAESEMSIVLLDSAVPKQPLITLSWDLHPGSCGCYYNIRASIREVVSSRSSWAYRQHTWILGDGTLRARSDSEQEYVLTFHLEIDWGMARCWILVQGRYKELCLESVCSGASPTADELRLQLSPGTTASLSELLLA
ncbi:unnamed protein product [Symbiodinium natans]|uniref:Uncharacterized protein n=1 Tax=Symbiodinium natans TaxID=878477 RepID=A0A812IN24_9DINO|nr:unnamed protein product [Symbiodinium natans]